MAGSEWLANEYREEYPYIGPPNSRYKQEVSETVGDHITGYTPRTPVTSAQVSTLLSDTPFKDGQFVKWGSTRYCHPVVQEGMDWFGSNIDARLDAQDETAAAHPGTVPTLVNGWRQRQIFEDQAREQVLWISPAVNLGKHTQVHRSSGQASADLSVFVSAAGLRSRRVGLYAEVVFPTANKYVSLTDTRILGKVDPDTGVTETPYHRLADDRDSPEHQMYTGCRPESGKLFVANALGNLVVNSVPDAWWQHDGL